jgi:hypothetical protein
MNARRLEFLIKISQEIENQESSPSSADSERNLVINQILKTISGDLPLLEDEGYKFEPPDKTLNDIQALNSNVTDEELEGLSELIEKLKASSPDEGRMATKELEGVAKENFSSRDFEKESYEKIFEGFFKASLISKIEKIALDIICQDLKDHGAFKLYEKRSISKIASRVQTQVIHFDKNLEIFNSRIKVYNNKTSVAFLGSAISAAGRALSGAGKYIAKAVPTLVEYGGKALSGAWKILRTFGKGALKLLPFVSIIWDLWDLVVYSRKVWTLWNDEFSKFSSYGKTSDLIKLDHIKSLYENFKEDTSISGLNKILDLVKITKLAQSFDICFIKGLTNFALVIEDIAAFFIDLIPYVGWVIDVALSFGIAYYGGKTASDRQTPFNNFKATMYQELESLKDSGSDSEFKPEIEAKKEEITKSLDPKEKPDVPKSFLETVKEITDTGLKSLKDAGIPAIA